MGDRERIERSESEISVKGELGSLFSVLYAIVKAREVKDNRQRQPWIVRKAQR